MREGKNALYAFPNVSGLRIVWRISDHTLYGPCYTFYNFSKSCILPVIKFVDALVHTFCFGVSGEESRLGTSSHQANCIEGHINVQ
jgi:hypothetical protein